EPGRKRRFNRVGISLNGRTTKTENSKAVWSFLGGKRVGLEVGLPHRRNCVTVLCCIEFKQWSNGGKLDKWIRRQLRRADSGDTQSNLRDDDRTETNQNG